MYLKDKMDDRFTDALFIFTIVCTVDLKIDVQLKRHGTKSRILILSECQKQGVRRKNRVLLLQIIVESKPKLYLVRFVQHFGRTI